jgi:hypothetical protein
MKKRMSAVLACSAIACLPIASMCFDNTQGANRVKSKNLSVAGYPVNYSFQDPRLKYAEYYTFRADTTMMTSHYIVGETPSGTLNGSNKAFTLAHSPLTGKDAVYLNGVLQVRGTDYTISGSTITFTAAPFSGDLIRVIYYY